MSNDAADAIAQGVTRRPIDRRRLSDQITAELERLIVDGRLLPGDTLPSERDLMSLFDVGRTSIREALFALQRKGVVSAQPGLRPVVIAPCADDIVAELSGTVKLFLATEPGTREFQRARRFFEPALARHAALHASDADIEAIGRALAACDAAAGDLERFVDADVDFHFAIVRATHSELVIALHRAVFEWLREQRISSIRPAGSSRAAQRAHRKVYEAIAARDGDRAEASMEAHLEEVEKYYWKARAARPPSAVAGPRSQPAARPRRPSRRSRS